MLFIKEQSILPFFHTNVKCILKVPQPWTAQGVDEIQTWGPAEDLLSMSHEPTLFLTRQLSLDLILPHLALLRKTSDSVKLFIVLFCVDTICRSSISLLQCCNVQKVSNLGEICYWNLFWQLNSDSGKTWEITEMALFVLQYFRERIIIFLLLFVLHQLNRFLWHFTSRFPL